MIEQMKYEYTDDMLKKGLSLKDVVIYNAIVNYGVSQEVKILEKELPLCKDISRSIKKLRRLGYIKETRFTKEELVYKLKNGLLDSDFICEWCGGKTNIIHEHHYPISKSEGGKELVKICPNCHCTYHKYF